MESYRQYIESEISRMPENRILEACVLYRQFFSNVPETAYYKALERMCRKGILIHLAKGLYYRPRQSRFGIVPITEQEIVEYYTGPGKGILIGYRMFNQKGLTPQISRQVEVLSVAVAEQKKNIGNVCVMNSEVELTEETVPVVETMEILQNYEKIEDLNKRVLAAYMRRFSEHYSDTAAVHVLDNRRYKKSTIAFLERFLNNSGTGNSLNRYLSPFSNYEIPEVEAFCETA